MFTLGTMGEYGIYHPNIIYDDRGNAVLTIYGIPQNERLDVIEKYPRYAEKLAFARRVVDALNNDNQLAALREAAKEYMDVADFPHIHTDYCMFCDADERQSHEKNCKYQTALNKLVTTLEKS